MRDSRISRLAGPAASVDRIGCVCVWDPNVTPARSISAISSHVIVQSPSNGSLEVSAAPIVCARLSIHRTRSSGAYSFKCSMRTSVSASRAEGRIARKAAITRSGQNGATHPVSPVQTKTVNGRPHAWATGRAEV